MKMTLLAMCVAAAFLPRSGNAFSVPGHEAIVEAALDLVDASTKAKVDAILEGETPDDAAIWLDRVRENFHFPEPSDGDEARIFAGLFPDNASWHFCDFPVGSKEYSFISKYSDTGDVVHALERAIAVLEGAQSKMTKLQALRTVIHLTGDIHQPLHCITGFFDISDMSNPVLLSDVDDPKTATQDRGGNQLFYTASQEFHALWDLGLTKRISSNVSTLASKLVAGHAAVPETPGDYHHWPETWAGDSMIQANAAYDQIKFKSAAFVPDPRHPGELMLDITVALPGGTTKYKQDQQPRELDQLTKAAVHLAQLLGKIDFKD